MKSQGECKMRTYQNEALLMKEVGLIREIEIEVVKSEVIKVECTNNQLVEKLSDLGNLPNVKYIDVIVR